MNNSLAAKTVKVGNKVNAILVCSRGAPMRYFWKRLLFLHPSRHHPTEWHQREHERSSRTWMMLIFTLTFGTTMTWVLCYHSINMRAVLIEFDEMLTSEITVNNCKVYWCSANWWHDGVSPLGIGKWAFWRSFVWIYGWEEESGYKSGTH